MSSNKGILLFAMKNRIGVVVLVLISVILVIALFSIKRDADKHKAEATEQINHFSNEVATLNTKLADETHVKETLYKDVETQKVAYAELTNNFAQVSTDLARSQSDLKAREDELKRKDAKITELENQNQALDKQAADLNIAITNLNVQIAETQTKLAKSEGNRAFLEKELKRMISDKQELEKQFNDITVLKAQI